MFESLLRKKTRVIIDTNFMLIPGSQGIDIVDAIKNLLTEPHELCVVQATEFELKQIIEGKTSGKGKDKFNAKLGLIMIKQQGLKVLPRSLGDGYADQIIMTYVKKDVIVATLDKALQKEVKDAKGRIITVRQGKHLILKQ